ncbi:MAG TPA: hypothetical protein VKZ18_12950 [Polyangia bacterium]|nr:hypothetical protein [Polyangia bacterium]
MRIDRHRLTSRNHRTKLFAARGLPFQIVSAAHAPQKAHVRRAAQIREPAIDPHVTEIGPGQEL